MTAQIPEELHNPELRFIKVASKDKNPVEKDWQNSRNYRYDDPELLAWLGQGGNYGISCGHGGLRVIDMDDKGRIFGLGVIGKLPKTYTTSSRENKEHKYIYCPELEKKLIFYDPDETDPKTGRLRHLGEIQGPGTQVVGPGSIHPDTRMPYLVLDKSPIITLTKAELLHIMAGVSFDSEPKAAKTQKQASISPLAAARAWAKSKVDPKRAYGMAALEEEASAVMNAPEGDRNNQLNKSAFSLGQLVGAGVLDHSEVESALEGAARASGLPQDEIEKSIRSGLESGIREPRVIPDNNEAKTSRLAFEDVMIDKGHEDKHDWHFSPTLAARSALNKLQLVMCEESNDIYRYSGQVWRPDGARKIDIALCGVAGDHVTSYALKETLRRIENSLKDEPVSFEPDPYRLPLKNGVANLLTGEVREYRPDDYELDPLEVTYDPEARCPEFLQFLESSCPNIADRLTLIDWFVATAIREPLPYALFLLGLGRNGKGVYERLLKRFFGESEFRDMGLAEIARSNFAAGNFYRARGWIASETGKHKAALGTDFIKMVSGDGTIDADVKNKNRIRFRPHFQTIIDTNVMPKIDDNSVGWKERFIKVDMPFSFVSEPDPNNPLEKQKDPMLFDRLISQCELSGILNLLLHRSKAIGRSRTIHKRPSSEMFAEYAEQSSSVTTFAELFLEYDPAMQGARVPSREIYDSYKEWCGYKVGEVVEVSYFGRYLRKLCWGIEPARPKIAGKDATVYPGLIFHKDRYSIAIQELKRIRGIAISDVLVSSSEANSKQSKNESGPQISFSEASEANLWNEIVKLFGEPACLVCDDQDKPGHHPGELQGEDSLIFHPKPPLPPKTVTAEPTKNKPASELPPIMHPKTASGDAKDVNIGVPPKDGTSGIKAEAAKEEHDRTPTIFTPEESGALEWALGSFTRGQKVTAFAMAAKIRAGKDLEINPKRCSAWLAGRAKA